MPAARASRRSACDWYPHALRVTRWVKNEASTTSLEDRPLAQSRAEKTVRTPQVAL